MKEKQFAWTYLWRAIFLALTVCMLVFIFAQSTQEGETSSMQSEQVTVLLQQVVAAIAPESPIATATGEAFDALHAFVRSAAHFVEYMALGVCAFASYLSFTRKKRYAVLIPLWVAFVALADECVQSVTADRAAQGVDLLVDILGGVAGCLMAYIILAIVLGVAAAWRRKKRKQESNV